MTSHPTIWFDCVVEFHKLPSIQALGQATLEATHGHEPIQPHSNTATATAAEILRRSRA